MYNRQQTPVILYCILVATLSGEYMLIFTPAHNLSHLMQCDTLASGNKLISHHFQMPQQPRGYIYMCMVCGVCVCMCERDCIYVRICVYICLCVCVCVCLSAPVGLSACINKQVSLSYCYNDDDDNDNDDNDDDDSNDI